MNGSTNNTNDLERERLAFESKCFEFEKHKSERELMLENRRYALERYRTRVERTFLNRNLGVLISATISLAAVLVSLGQIWIAKISRDKELEIASFQTLAERERLDKQKEKELALQSAEYERQWNLSRAKFITENKQTLFNGSGTELNRMSQIIETLFPGDIASRMFADLKNTADSRERQEVWSNAQNRLQVRSNSSSNPESSPAKTPTSTQNESSNPGNITGTVITQDGQVVPKVTLSLMKEDAVIASTLTDSSGKFEMKVPSGTYKLVVRAFGYFPSIRSDVTVLAGSTSVMNIKLHSLKLSKLIEELA